MRDPDAKGNGSNKVPCTELGISIMVAAIVGGIIGVSAGGAEGVGKGAIIGAGIGGLFLGYVPFLLWRLFGWRP